MKLTKGLRKVILAQFKSGSTIEYLANLYGFSLGQIEQLIRRELIEGVEKVAGET